MKKVIGELSEQTARRLLKSIAPGSVLISVTVPDGSFSNYTHILKARRKAGGPYEVVVRRYKVFGNYDRGEKARREFKTYEWLDQHHVPAPKPLCLDEMGFWELAAAVRPMIDAEDWKTDRSPTRRFIENLLKMQRRTFDFAKGSNSRDESTG